MAQMDILLMYMQLFGVCSSL